MYPFLEIILKLGLALIMGGIIGLERDLTGHEAGMRTQILVGMGSASFIMIGASTAMTDGDLSRIVQGVATGLGFLGAGAIIKEGMNVKGLTTAASIWMTAAIGVAIGFGSYEIAFTAFAFTIIALSLFAIMERKLNLKLTTGTLVLFMDGSTDFPADFLRKMKKRGMRIDRKEIERSSKETRMRFDISLPRRFDIERMISEVDRIDGMKKIQWEDREAESGKSLFKW